MITPFKKRHHNLLSRFCPVKMVGVNYDVRIHSLIVRYQKVHTVINLNNSGISFLAAFHDSSNLTEHLLLPFLIGVLAEKFHLYCIVMKSSVQMRMVNKYSTLFL